MELEFGEPAAKPRVVAVIGIREHDTLRDAILERLADLIERNLRFGLKRDLLRHTGLLAPRRVVRPIFRQIKPQSDRQAGVIAGSRQRHRHLSIA